MTLLLVRIKPVFFDGGILSFEVDTGILGHDVSGDIEFPVESIILYSLPLDPGYIMFNTHLSLMDSP